MDSEFSIAPWSALKEAGGEVVAVPFGEPPIYRQICLIRPLTDQNSLAHSLRPIDMMRQGWLSSFRQASQQ